jgi:arylsulfatase A
MSKNIFCKYDPYYMRVIGITVFMLNLGCVLAPPHLWAAVPVTKPNIIVFLVDDMGWGDSRAYNPESRISMPNLERLATEGIKFTNAHSTPKCAPTRYSLLTGNYHWRGRYSYGAWDYRGGSQILDDQWTIAQILRDHGYRTAFIGKAHLGGDFYKKNSEEFVPRYYPEDDIDFSRGLQHGPLSYGFDYSYLSLRGNFTSPYAYFENDQLDGDVNDLFIWLYGWYGDSWIFSDGIGLPDWNSAQVGPVLMEKAIAFIDGHLEENASNNSNNPFFMYYAATAAHGPYTPPEYFFGEPVKGVTKISWRTDMIYEIDVALGFLLRALEERSLSENTLIVFVSDNGNPDDSVDSELAAGHDASGGLRGYKGGIWENSHRIPFVMKWGDGTKAGSVISPGTASDQLVAVHDLASTLAALVESDLPYDQGRDSFNLLPIITGVQPEDEPVRDYLVEEARELNEQAVAPRFAILDNFWKLILDERDEVAELYNLSNDRAESTNLIGAPQQAERIERMRNMLLQLRDYSDHSSPMLLASGRSGPPLMGKPLYQRGREAGVYIWKNAFDGPYHMEVSGDGPLSVFEIKLLASHPLLDVVPRQLEVDDNLSWSENQLAFTSRVAAWIDGVDFVLPVGAQALLTIHEESQSDHHGVYVGSSVQALVPTDWIVDVDTLPVLPTFHGGKDLGLFVGRDASDSEVRARWNGDGENHRAEVDLFFSGNPDGVTPIGFEPNDTIVTTTNMVSIDSIVSVWWDGVDIRLQPGMKLGLAYNQDGFVQPHWVNPATHDLGLPNAYRLPRAEPYGKPDYDPGAEAGLYLWQDKATGVWHLRGAAGGGGGRYTGEIVSDQPFTAVSAISLESNDVLDTTDPTRIVFDLGMWSQWEDGIDFQAAPGAQLTLNLTSGNPFGVPGKAVRIGEMKWPVDNLPLELGGW